MSVHLIAAAFSLAWLFVGWRLYVIGSTFMASMAMSAAVLFGIWALS